MIENVCLVYCSYGFMCNKIKQVCAAIVLQEPARLLQHLFYFIAYETRAARVVSFSTSVDHIIVSLTVFEILMFDFLSDVGYFESNMTTLTVYEIFEVKIL